MSFNEFDIAFKSLKRNKAKGIDDINGNIIIDIYDVIKNILFRVFKASIGQGIFPTNLKIAKVTPVFKSGEKSNVSNYRPISILPVFSKVLERIMYNRVYNHLILNNLIYENQLGFQKNCSTEHAIMQLTRNISESFEKGEYTLGVFIDLSKAFDTVDHTILIEKLQYYGIKGTNLEWLKSYLRNRKQYIHSEGVAKQLLDIKCGVPQGSILGPLLFLIYVNDFNKASNLLRHIMFADDTNLFLADKNINILFNNMNIELQKVSSWFKSNKLSLNINKTKWTIFHPAAKKRLINELPSLTIDTVLIKKEKVTKFLGVYIDENWTWKHHINAISSKISKSIGILYKAREFLTRNNLKQLYFSFIHCYINYANIVWASTHKSKLEGIYRHQKHAARLINFKHHTSHAIPLLRDLNAFSVFQQNIYNVLCFMYKCKNRLCPKILSNIYIVKSENKYTMRNRFISEPRCRTSVSRFCITYRAPYLWNKIILPLFSSTDELTYPLFSSKLKEYIFTINNIKPYF